MNEKLLERLEAYEKTCFALGHAMGILSYDGNTSAPPKSAIVRGETMGELSRMSYELTTGPEAVKLLEDLEAAKDTLDPVTRRKAVLMRRIFDETDCIPVDEYVEYVKQREESEHVWKTAKQTNDFKLFEPYLQKMFDYARKFALYRAPDKDPYTTQLDSFEKGLTAEKCDKFFGDLKKRLVPIAAKAAEKSADIDVGPISVPFPVEKQKLLSDYLMDVIGLDKERCALGETEHPFTTDFSKYDVRITTHYYETMPAASMYSVIHEGGHALYELGIGDDIALGMLGSGVSMAIHESQSRFYENIVGRSEAFCELVLPKMKEIFSPLLDGVDVKTFWKMVTKVQPSLVRTEADEVTYCLHIMIRYELEKKMMSGELKAGDLPGEWNRLYKEYLGIDVPSDKEGVLQDVHWSEGLIGYFPSYAIGSAYGAQYLKEMGKEFDVWEAVRSGNIAKISAWLENKIWRHGKMIDPCELFESICGPLDANVFADYLEQKYI
ncbi:MAG: carboxypeptidase M32 [Clostridia bacterium]|nr:carboxypeptidase M32 [Clostridia bacterium]